MSRQWGGRKPTRRERKGKEAGGRPHLLHRPQVMKYERVMTTTTAGRTGGKGEGVGGGVNGGKKREE